MAETRPSANLWQHTAPPLEIGTGPLQGEVEADLAIVGGGFTGCSAALHAARRGLSVRLIEAGRIGDGGSGRNVGLVNAGLWLSPDDVVAALGDDGERLNKALAAAPDLVFALIANNRIDCEARREGTLHCAHAPAGMEMLRDRHFQLTAAGAPVTLLDADETARRTGTTRYCGALHDARAGTIQPLAFCRGLARAAAGVGATLHESTPALAVGREGEGWTISTPQGRLRAAKLIVATNAYHDNAAGVAKPQFVPVHYFQIATAPLGANLRGSVLPGGEGCWDTATVMSSFRLDAAGRLLLGGIGAADSVGGGTHRAWAKRAVHRFFPQIGDVPIEFAWSGRIAMTGDHIPKILRLGRDGYAVFGYSGRGIGPGITFGKALAETLAGDGEAALPVTPVNAHHERFAAAKALYYETGARLAHFLGARGQPQKTG